MAQPLYFVEGLQRLNIEQANEIGLQYALQGRLALGEYTGAGPGGNQGCVLCVTSDRHGYYPAKQTWMRIPQSDLKRDHIVYVGYWNDSPPTPDELQVEKPIGGKRIKLCDGHEWLVPIARAWSDKEGSAGWINMLPGRLRINDQGKWESGGVESRYAPLWDIAVAWTQSVLAKAPDENGQIRFDFDGIHNAAAVALATNHRVHRAEVALLGLLDDQYQSATEILHAVIDLERVIDWSKKNLAPSILAGSVSKDGEADTTQTTAQP